jgi:UBX domain-containing protein 6
LLREEEQGAKAAALLSRVLNNIISKPGDEKYRKLRLSNKKVQDELVNVSGGLEFLQAAGFQLVFDEADGYAVLPEGEPLEQLHAALRALEDTFKPQQPQPKVANPPIQWSDSAVATADQAAASQAGSAPPREQRPQDAQPASRSASCAAAEPRDRQTQVLLPENPQ